MGKESHPACVLWGGYAGGNTGDELTLAAALHDVRSRFGDSVAVLSRNPEYTQRLFPDASVIPYSAQLSPALQRRLRRFDLRERRPRWLPDLHTASWRLRDWWSSEDDAMSPWVRAIVNCRQLYLVGGGYLTDLFDLDYFLLPLRVAIFASVPIVSAPLGLGPFVSEEAAALVVQALSRASVVVRDESSLEFCHRNRISATLQPDDGFRAPDLVSGLFLLSDADDYPMGAGLRRPRVGVCVFQQYGADAFFLIEKWWVRFLSSLRRLNGELDLEGFCFHIERSLDYATTVKLFRSAGWNAEHVQAPALDFRAAIRTLCRYDVIVSTRFHAIVVASALGIPHVAVASGEYYTTKMSAALRPVNIACRLVRPPGDCPEEAASYVMSICRDRRRAAS